MVNLELRLLHLGSAEGNILLHLLTQGDGVRQEDIVAELDISKPAVSKALDTLAGKGYITRRKDPSDRRARLVQLTGRAEAIAPRLESIYDAAFTQAAQGLSEAEISTFVDIFGRVSENFTRAGKGRFADADR